MNIKPGDTVIYNGCHDPYLIKGKSYIIDYILHDNDTETDYIYYFIVGYDSIYDSVYFITKKESRREKIQILGKL